MWSLASPEKSGRGRDVSRYRATIDDIFERSSVLIAKNRTAVRAIIQESLRKGAEKISCDRSKVFPPYLTNASFSRSPDDVTRCTSLFITSVEETIPSVLSPAGLHPVNFVRKLNRRAENRPVSEARFTVASSARVRRVDVKNRR